ncbi:MAG: protein-L-isoaspartate O-methyltransferase [Rhodospirillaceae bacterium]|nr:protein-L-isoaspartate O-methyltransferase [Rhodospirillaceae bacterium]|tara:strand:+ start:3915 stop:4565 length:651 start_codon:yes stop_codon:yes gene_type:complete
MNIEEARDRMVEQQLRTWDVFDYRVLRAVRECSRELFVPNTYHDFAFADMEIPLDHDQAMMNPKVEGRLLQSLSLNPNDRVLEIGTGSGFLTACLAHLSQSVLSIDIFAGFTAEARKKLKSLNIQNVNLLTQDAFSMAQNEQFDAIAVTGSIPTFNEHFVQMLRPGGRMFVIIGKAPAMEAILITQHNNGKWTQESLFETVVAPLSNANQQVSFVL